MFDPSIWTTVLVLQAVICAAIGAAIGTNKGQAGAGFVLGLLFGFIGIIIVAVMGESPAVRDERERRQHMALAAVAGARSAPAAPSDVEAQLGMIEDLARRGQISDEERAEARRNVLAQASTTSAAPAVALEPFVPRGELIPRNPNYKPSTWPYYLAGGIILLVVLLIAFIAAQHR